MLIPDAVLSFLLENITQVIKYNYHLIADAKENLEALQRDLESLRDLMKDLAKYNIDSDSVKGTVKRIRKVLGQAEDVVDTYLLHAAVQKPRNWFGNKKALRDLGEQVRKIQKEVSEINRVNANNATELLKYQASRGLAIAMPKEDPVVEEEHVIGFENATEDVSKLVAGGAEQFEAISIIGMLGLGKTTLAKKVFNDLKVDHQYRIRAFVYVSEKPDRKDVFHKILSSIKNQVDVMNYDLEKVTAEMLKDHLQQLLSGKSYLIVLDDVWDKGDWDKFKAAFPNNTSKRCRVLITTRNEEVAWEASKRTRDHYHLDFLKQDKSQQLLRWKVFEGGEFPNDVNVRNCELQILAKCDGLPLAIVVISGILCNDPRSADHWKQVAEGVKGYIARDAERTTDVIKLMYRHLPNHLKGCFLYMGVFKEDFEIPAWKLVRLWIAEGLIEREEGLNLEVIAERNLNELVYRSLVMVAKRASNDKIKACRLHDTLREFCKNQAVEEDLFKEIKRENLSLFLSPKEALGEYRRLCINNINAMDYLSSKPSGKHVRSFLTFNQEKKDIPPKQLNSIPKAFKLLRVMEVESLIFSSFPSPLLHLVLLKYVAVSSQFSSLPSEMSSMWNLQTLIVNTTRNTLDIRANIWGMPQLRHLHTNVPTILPLPPPPDAKGQTGNFVDFSIQTLSTISPDSCTEEVFLRTQEIKKLGIRGTLTKLFAGGAQSALFGSRLRSLENLKLLNDDAPSSALYEFPSHVSFPRQLTKLTLLNTRLEWKEMSTLEKVEKLEVLKLKDNAFTGKFWKTEKGGFPLLKHLHLGKTDLMVWELVASADDVPFPELKRLEFHYCGNLQDVPQGLVKLQILVLHCTNTLLASSAKKLQKLEEAKRHNTNSTFKLSVYPPDY